MQDTDIRLEIARHFAFARQKRKEFLVSQSKEFGITTSSRGALIHTIYDQEGAVQDDISAILSMDKAFVTRELNALHASGLIRREKDARDHRKNHIYLTEEGRKVAESIHTIITAWLDKAYAGFSDAEIDKMLEFMQRIKENAKK